MNNGGTDKLQPPFLAIFPFCKYNSISLFNISKAELIAREAKMYIDINNTDK